ncbi:MAG: hypothetical protein ACRCUP_01260 [Mycoplasmatales bacterium]
MIKSAISNKFNGKINDVSFSNEQLFYTTEFLLIALEEKFNINLNSSDYNHNEFIKHFSEDIHDAWLSNETMSFHEIEQEIYLEIQSSEKLEDLKFEELDLNIEIEKYHLTKNIKALLNKNTKSLTEGYPDFVKLKSIIYDTIDFVNSCLTEELSYEDAVKLFKNNDYSVLGENIDHDYFIESLNYEKNKFNESFPGSHYKYFNNIEPAIEAVYGEFPEYELEHRNIKKSKTPKQTIDIDR